MAADDFARVRELRVSRLRQLSRSAATMADRAYVSAVFAGHPYGHGALGTTASLEALSVHDARAFWETTFGPVGATLVVCGDVDDSEVARAASSVFQTWVQPPPAPPMVSLPALVPDPRVILVSRPGSPQSELRIGHAGPGRTTPAYHALVVLNAVIGGQFTSRINRRLREEKGITYGAHTAFDFRLLAGSFSCDSSVQADATGTAIADVLDEFAAARQESVAGEELSAAKASLTRGYVRNFETAGQLGRAAAQLATYGLPDDTFDRFVPLVEAVASPDVLAAAGQVVRPDEATVVVVGDPDVCLPSLGLLGRSVVELKPEF
jgi:zinc protease